MRMLGDSEDAKIVLIGNSLGNNHFYEASLDPDYEHIHIGWKECVMGSLECCGTLKMGCSTIMICEVESSYTREPFLL